MRAMRGLRLPFHNYLVAICYSLLLVSCTPATSVRHTFFYIKHPNTSPTLFWLDTPNATQSLGEIPLNAPSGCAFGSLSPAPNGPFVAVEWQCADGPRTQAANLDEKKAYFLLDNPSSDSHFLAWSPDGKSIYLKAGALTNPQILRVDVASRQPTALSIPAETYAIAVSPTDGAIIWALTHGIGSGSQIWGSYANSTSSQLVLADRSSIIGLMRFSPDGQRIAAIRLPDDQSPLPPGELWIVDADGRRPHFAATADAGRGMPPVWSPDSQKIAFVGRDRARDPASLNLSILTILDLQLSTLNYKPLFPPTWSSDNAALYFTQGSDGKMELWFYEVSTGKAQKLFDDACCAGWSK